MSPKALIWVNSASPHRNDWLSLDQALADRAQLEALPAPPGPELMASLEGLNLEQRPQACLNLVPGSPARSLSCLPCPVLGWRGGEGLEGVLPDEPSAAAEQLLAAAQGGLRNPWFKKVNINLPLSYLRGGYRQMALKLPFPLEIGLDAMALDTFGPAELEWARQNLAGRVATCHLPFNDLIPGSEDALVGEAASRRLSQAVETAAHLGARQCVIHLGYDWRVHRDHNAFTARWLERLEEPCRRLVGRGMRLAIENTFEPRPDILLAVREQLALGIRGIQVGFCLDVGHAMCFSSTDLPSWWQAFSPHLLELHLHDNHGDDDQHLPLGWGCLDWNFLEERLLELESLPVLTLEPHREAVLWASFRGLAHLWPRLAQKFLVPKTV